MNTFDNVVRGANINERWYPFRNAYDLLNESHNRQVQETGVYDAIIADGDVTKNNRRYSRKDFVYAKRLYFGAQQNRDKDPEVLKLTIADEFFPDGSIRLDRHIGQVIDMDIIDSDNSWYVTCRFAIFDIPDRINPWFATMRPLLTKLHGVYKAIPCGILPNSNGSVTEENGVHVVNGFLIRSVMLSCNSGFSKADFIRPVISGNQSPVSSAAAPNLSSPTHNRPHIDQRSIFSRRRI